MFNSLGQDQIQNIVDIQLGQVRARLNEKKIELAVDHSAIDFWRSAGLISGLRCTPTQALIQQELLNKLAKRMIAGDIKPGDRLK